MAAAAAAPPSASAAARLPAAELRGAADVAPPPRPPLFPGASLRFALAPMVDASELPFRLLAREFGATVTWSPMLHARLTAEEGEAAAAGAGAPPPRGGGYLAGVLSTAPAADRPLVAQLAGDEPRALVAAARAVLARGGVDAVDLNLGCPQGIAKRGHYGAFLLDEPDLVERLVRALAGGGLGVPVTVKLRCLASARATVDLARRLERAGAAALTVHGRTRQNMKQATTAADWRAIAAVKAAVRVPVLANGSVGCLEDALACLAATRADGVMSSEAALEAPSLFSDGVPTAGPLRAALDAAAAAAGAALPRAPPTDGAWPDAVPRVSSVGLARRYVALCREHAGANWGVVKGHCIKLLFGLFRAEATRGFLLAALEEGGRAAAGGDARGALDRLDAALDAVEAAADAAAAAAGLAAAALPAGAIPPPRGFVSRAGYAPATEAKRQALLAAWRAARGAESPESEGGGAGGGASGGAGARAAGEGEGEGAGASAAASGAAAPPEAPAPSSATAFEPAPPPLGDATGADDAPVRVAPAWPRPEYLLDARVPGAWYARHRPDVYGGAEPAGLDLAPFLPSPAPAGALAREGGGGGGARGARAHGRAGAAAAATAATGGAPADRSATEASAMPGGGGAQTWGCQEEDEAERAGHQAKRKR